MRRIIAFAFLIASCSHQGPKIEDYVPHDRDQILVPTVQDSKKFQTLLVYGDSLSDPGNLSKNTFHFILPHQIFYRGRFSNGPIWADYVEKATRWNVHNFAVSGARTHTGPWPERWVLPDLPQQVSESEDLRASLDRQTTLITLWIGPNNYLRNGGEFEDGNGRTRSEALEKGVKRTLGDIEKEVERLASEGFSYFALGTMPELGGINRNPKSGRIATDKTLFEATRLHNIGLRELITKLQRADERLQITTFQAFEINKETYERPGDFGFSVLDKPCFVGDLKGNFYGEKTFCEDLLGYKFWEYVHPNTMMHCFYAGQFLTDAHQAKFVEASAKSVLIETCKRMKPVRPETL